MNILIYGGRDYKGTEQDFDFLDEVMEKRVSFSSPPVVISGNARGADQLGESWANSRNVAVTLFPAKWKQADLPSGIQIYEFFVFFVSRQKHNLR